MSIAVEIDTAILRLALALVAGALIGLEREWRQKNAGVKTNALVAIGAAGFAMVSDPDSRIAANIVTGIGFIGAGVIMHRGLTVQGVTTAATLWANAALSIALGLGHLAIGAVLFAGIVIVQFIMRRVDSAIAHARRSRMPSRVELAVHCDEAALSGVNSAWSDYAAAQQFKVFRRNVVRGPDHLAWRVHFSTPERQPIDLTELEERLVREPGVTRVEARHAGFEEE